MPGYERTHRLGGFITPCGYRAAKSRKVCARRLRNAVLVEEIVKFSMITSGSTGFVKSGVLCAGLVGISGGNKLAD